MQAWPGLAVAMGVILSPNGLILLGNHLGTAATAFLGSLVLAGGIAVLTAHSYSVVSAWFPGIDGEARGLQAAFGPFVAMLLPLCARMVFMVCASTGLLVIAGYVFNEVFVLWFPNLGFSFCLLGFLLVLNLLGDRVAAIAQSVFVAMALGGLLILSVIGLLGPGQVASVPGSPGPATLAAVRGVLAGLVIFVGADLAVFTTAHGAQQPGMPGKWMSLGIVVAGLMFWVWGFVSLRYVPLARLAESTVPHMVTARAMLGQSGRVIMGLVVLAGVSAAVNALLLAGSRMLIGMATQRLLPAVLGWAPQRAPIPLLLLAAGPALMMAEGMGGEPETEIYTRAGILFWLLLYVAVHLAVFVLTRRADGPQPATRPYTAPLALLGAGVVGVGIVGLVWVDSEPEHLLMFMLIVAGGVALLSLLWLGLRRSLRGSANFGGQ